MLFAATSVLDGGYRYAEMLWAPDWERAATYCASYKWRLDGELVSIIRSDDKTEVDD